MKALGVATWVGLSSIISALVQAWTATKLWTWFGITTILGFIVSVATIQLATDVKEESFDVIIRKSVSASIGKWVGCGLILIISWVTGSVIGWVH